MLMVMILLLVFAAFTKMVILLKTTQDNIINTPIKQLNLDFDNYCVKMMLSNTYCNN